MLLRSAYVLVSFPPPEPPEPWRNPLPGYVEWPFPSAPSRGQREMAIYQIGLHALREILSRCEAGLIPTTHHGDTELFDFVPHVDSVLRELRVPADVVALLREPYDRGPRIVEPGWSTIPGWLRRRVHCEVTSQACDILW